VGTWKLLLAGNPRVLPFVFGGGFLLCFGHRTGTGNGGGRLDWSKRATEIVDGAAAAFE
jgi:hypothetical protein